MMRKRRNFGPSAMWPVLIVTMFSGCSAMGKSEERAPLETVPPIPCMSVTAEALFDFDQRLALGLATYYKWLKDYYQHDGVVREKCNAAEG